MTPDVLIKCIIVTLGAGVPLALGVSFTVAAFTTPLPDRRKGRA